MPTSKHIIFEDTIRLMVARGSGLATNLVIPSFHNDTAPDEGLFASAQVINQSTQGLTTSTQYSDNTQSFTVDRVMAMTMWQLDWFREGAMHSAFAFRDWLRSQTGTTWCATANIDGRIRFINVYEGGSGYEDNVEVELTHPDGEEGITATGICEVVHGRMVRVRMTNYGTGYRDIPDMNAADSSYPTIAIKTTTGTGAVLSPGGFGMAVMDTGTIQVLNMTAMQEMGAKYEERATITLTTCHQYLHKDEESGRIEHIYGDLNGLDLSSGI